MTEYSQPKSSSEYSLRLRELDLATVYHILLEKFWLIVASVGVFLLLGLIYITIATRIYQATTTLSVDRSDTPVINMSNTSATDPSTSLADMDMLKTIELELGRRSLLVRVLKRPEVQADPELASIAVAPDSSSNENDLLRLSKRINVTLRRGSRLIDIAVQHKNPETAKLLANSMANEYILELIMRRSGSSSETSEFLDQEGEKMKGKLDDSELAMQDLKALSDIHARVIEVQTDISELSKRYLDRHPKLIAARNLLKDLRAQFISEMIRRNIVPIEFPAGITVDVATTQPEKVDREMARQEGRYSVMQRDITTDRTIYDAVLQRRKERDVTGSSLQVGIHIVESAATPWEPVKPRKFLVLSLCLVGGTLVGLVLAFWLNSLDSSLKTVDDAEEYLDLSLLGAIPDLRDPNRQKLVFEAPFGEGGVEHVIEDKLRESIPIARRYYQRALELKEEVLAKWRKKEKPPLRRHSRSRSDTDPKKEEELRPLIMVEDPGSLVSEAFRSMRAALKLLGAQRDRKTFLFTSAVPSEGKSFISANFAVSLAMEGARTLLIEADLRKPAIRRIFKVSGAVSGLTECLTGQATLSAVVRPSQVKGLDLLLAGNQSPNPAELLSAGGFTQLLEQAAQHYDRVVIDSSPVLAVSDTLLICSVPQTVCLIVRAGSTPREAVRRAIRLLANYHAPLAGFVMNRLPHRSGFGSSPYYYYYQAGEKYGEVYGTPPKQ